MMPGLGLRHAAPERYGTLEHPGDAFSFDIFTQVARAVRGMLSKRYGIRVERVFATGASQSAFHLTTYVNALDVHAAAVDAFLLQGRAGAGAPIGGWTFDRFDPADNEARRRLLAGRDQIRGDARVPVMVVQSETDVFGRLTYLPARQRDSEQFRLWEVAGAAHCDTYFLCASASDSGSLPLEDLAALIARANATGVPTEVPINFRTADALRAPACVRRTRPVGARRQPAAVGRPARRRRRGSTRKRRARDRLRRRAHALGRRAERSVVGTRPARRHDGAVRHDAATRRRRTFRAATREDARSTSNASARRRVPRSPRGF